MRLLGYKELYAKGFRYSRAHLWRLIKAGRFPKPIKLGLGSRNAWLEQEIDAFIDSKVAERDAPPRGGC